MFVSENKHFANSNNYVITLTNLICIMIIREAKTAKAEQVIILKSS